MPRVYVFDFDDEIDIDDWDYEKDGKLPHHYRKFVSLDDYDKLLKEKMQVVSVHSEEFTLEDEEKLYRLMEKAYKGQFKPISEANFNK